MLTLTRRNGESIWLTLGDTRVRVLIKDIRGSKVKVSVDAPPAVRIYREELQREIDDARAAAEASEQD